MQKYKKLILLLLVYNIESFNPNIKIKPHISSKRISKNIISNNNNNNNNNSPIKNTVLITSWFYFSTQYNIENKIRLNLLNLPYFQSTFSLGVGALFTSIFYLINFDKIEKIPNKLLIKIIPISILHYIGHLSAVISTSSGAVSFTQIIKSAEPVFTTLFNLLLFNEKISNYKLLSLIIIIFGVSFASISELNFSWNSFNGAMISNSAFALRNVLSKKYLKNNNISSDYYFYIVTLFSFLISIPISFYFEKFPINISNEALLSITKTGIYFQIYNIVAMMLLSNINSVTHSVINTLKRIVILISCVLFFNNPININGIFGSIIAIFGTFLYSKF